MRGDRIRRFGARIHRRPDAVTVNHYTDNQVKEHVGEPDSYDIVTIHGIYRCVYVCARLREYIPTYQFLSKYQLENISGLEKKKKLFHFNLDASAFSSDEQYSFVGKIQSCRTLHKMVYSQWYMEY